jgi:predicted short-subunit dehydrogenase-like oxidoreductase (DUF2520 family)
MTSLPGGQLSIAIAACGRVATAVGVLLEGAGHRVTAIASRTRSSLERARERLGGPEEFSLEGPVPPCDVLLLGVPDGAVRTVTAALTPSLSPRTVVWHLSGASGIAPLGPAVSRGCLAAALHPVQTCPDLDLALERLPASAWGVTTSPGLEDWAAELLRRDLGGHPVHVAEVDRPLWHAASVVAANGISALLELSSRMLAGSGVADPAHVFGPLALAAVANAVVRGPLATLTGPVARGERDVISRHEQALAPAPELLRDYRLVVRLVTRMSQSDNGDLVTRKSDAS